MDGFAVDGGGGWRRALKGRYALLDVFLPALRHDTPRVGSLFKGRTRARGLYQRGAYMGVPTLTLRGTRALSTPPPATSLIRGGGGGINVASRRRKARSSSRCGGFWWVGSGVLAHAGWCIRADAKGAVPVMWLSPCFLTSLFKSTSEVDVGSLGRRRSHARLRICLAVHLHSITYMWRGRCLGVLRHKGCITLVGW